MRGAKGDMGREKYFCGSMLENHAKSTLLIFTIKG